MSDDPAVAMARMTFRDVDHEGLPQYESSAAGSAMSGSQVGPDDSVSNVSAGGKSNKLMLEEQLEAALAEIATLKTSLPVPVVTTVCPKPKFWLSAIGLTGMFKVKSASVRTAAFKDRGDT